MKKAEIEIINVIRKVPSGKVATYGQIAKLAGLGRNARQVGYALKSYSGEEEVPWHRIINVKGQISFKQHSRPYKIQKEKLLDEGIEFNGEKISLKQFRWEK